jgi:hypothetical protein
LLSGISLGYNLHIQKRGTRIAEQKSAPTKCIAFFNDATWGCLFNPKNIRTSKKTMHFVGAYFMDGRPPRMQVVVFTILGTALFCGYS